MLMGGQPHALKQAEAPVSADVMFKPIRKVDSNEHLQKLMRTMSLVSTLSPSTTPRPPYLSTDYIGFTYSLDAHN